MSKRLTDREQLQSQLNHLTDSEVEDVLDYLVRLETKRTGIVRTDSGEDDLLSALSGAYENRRARQVLEWETVRRRADSFVFVQAGPRL